MEVVDALLGNDALPNGDSDEPPNKEGLLTPPNGNGFGSFGITSSFFSSLFDGSAASNILGGCSIAFSLSPLGSGTPNKEPEGTLGGVNCALLLAKKVGIVPPSGTGGSWAAEGNMLGVEGAPKGLERTSAGLGIDDDVPNTPKLKGNVAGTELDPDDDVK